MPSGVIRAFRYDAVKHRLDIRFTSGHAYSYLDVPPPVAEGLAAAPSKGRYFQRVIRDRFDFRRDRTHDRGPETDTTVRN